MPPVSQLVIAVDGLRASPLGPYGGTAATPRIDRLAAEGVLFDRCYAVAPELDAAYGGWWRGGVQAWASGAPATLLTDDDSLVPLADEAGFDRVEVFPAPEACPPATTLDETWLAAQFGRLADALDDLIPTQQGSACWVHTCGLFGPWDAPWQHVEEKLREDDLAIEPSAVTAGGCVDPHDPDAGFVAACRYATQVEVLDACVAGLLDYLEQAASGEPLDTTLLGVRGFALGEHGTLGADTRLYAESLHVPVIRRYSDGRGALSRVGNVIGGAEVFAPGNGEGVVRQASRTGARAVTTQEWRLVVPAQAEDSPQAELFLQPDDRWEVNNVASLMPDALEAMQALLSPDSV